MAYNVKYTNNNKPDIVVQSESELSESLSVNLFGRAFLEYGEQLNESLLKLLENCACPEFTDNPGRPDLGKGPRLINPVEGQLWYNTTQQLFFYWNAFEWVPLSIRSDVAANWGQIAHGEVLPRPVNLTNNYEFPYSQCIWMVSPQEIPTRFNYYVCTTDSEAVVTMLYRTVGDAVPTPGTANYLIIGIKNNGNTGIIDCTYDVITPLTPTPTVTPTPTSTPAPTPGEGFFIMLETDVDILLLETDGGLLKEI
jgi:hypothetical protein